MSSCKLSSPSLGQHAEGDPSSRAHRPHQQRRSAPTQGPRRAPNLSVEQAFELTDATAERSAAAGCIKLSEETAATYLRSNVALMRKMIADGYQDPQTLQKRIEDVEAWLAAPKLLEADANAEYAAVIEIDLAQLTEPILACPNDPDDVKLLSDVANTPINDVFLGSCMTNIGHYRAAGEIWRGQPFNSTVDGGVFGTT